MPAPDPLLQDILSAPDDDGPRRALAGWCRQHGESTRAEMIEMQLKLSAAADDPDTAAFKLATDIAQLSRSHGDGWLQFDGLAPYVDGYRYIRGCVELARLPARTFVDHAAELCRLAPLRHLDLTGLGLDVAQALFESPFLEQIRSLSLDRAGLGDEQAQLLAASPMLGELRWLSLALNDIDMEGADALAASRGLPKLEYVSLFGNPVDPTEQLTSDQGVILERRLPDTGVELERRHGPIPWLHTDVALMSELPPRRF